MQQEEGVQEMQEGEDVQPLQEEEEIMEVQKMQEAENVEDPGREWMQAVLTTSPHNVILSALNHVVKKKQHEKEPWREMVEVFHAHLEDLVAVSQPPPPPAEPEIASNVEAVDGGVDSAEASLASTSEQLVESMKENGQIMEASAYLLEQQPHHRMMSTLSAGLGLLKAMSGKR